MAGSRGLVGSMDYFPGALPYKAKLPNIENIAQGIQYLDAMYHRVQREEFMPIQLGRTDVVESISAQDIYQTVRERTMEIFANCFYEQFKEHMETNFDSDTTYSTFNISRNNFVIPHLDVIEADRFFTISYQTPGLTTSILFVIPIFSKVVRRSGEVNYTLRQFYPHLVKQETISVYFYDRGNKKFFVPEERTNRIGEMALETIRNMVEIACRQENEYPVAAATWIADKVFFVPRPYRHHDVVQSQEYHEYKAKNLDAMSIQGFITNHRNFVSRKRAMEMAVRCKSFLDPMSLVVSNQMEMAYSEIEKQNPPDKLAELALRFMGIHQEADTGRDGYVMRDVALFSEDMW